MQRTACAVRVAISTLESIYLDKFHACRHLYDLPLSCQLLALLPTLVVGFLFPQVHSTQPIRTIPYDSIADHVVKPPSKQRTYCFPAACAYQQTLQQEA
jgi:hypothetical protein